MQKFTIINAEGKEIPTTKKEFYETLKSGGYEIYEQGNIYVLLPKSNETLAEVYRVHHNDVSRQWAENDRRSRCLDEHGRICRRNCQLCDRERESHAAVSLDEREENGIQHSDNDSDVLSNIIKADMVVELRSILTLLEDTERDLVYAMYLNETTASMADYAEESGIPYSTIRSLRDRAFRHIAKMAPHLKDYL